MTASYSSSDARDHFPELIKRAKYGNERAIVTIRGEAAAAIISIADLEILEALEDERDVRAAKKARQDMKKQGGIPLDEVKKRFKK